MCEFVPLNLSKNLNFFLFVYLILFYWVRMWVCVLVTICISFFYLFWYQCLDSYVKSTELFSDFKTLNKIYHINKHVLNQTFFHSFYSYFALFFPQAWIATRRVSKDDWVEWLRRLSIELLKESPSPSLRSCWALAQQYNPLAK